MPTSCTGETTVMFFQPIVFCFLFVENKEVSVQGNSLGELCVVAIFWIFEENPKLFSLLSGAKKKVICVSLVFSCCIEASTRLDE